MTNQFIISAVGANRVGIVARLARVVYECRCNFEDSRMTFLGAHFSLMILVTGDQPDLFEKLKQGCEKISREGDLSVSVFRRLVEPDALDQIPAPDFNIQVRGADRMGIVYRTSQLLAALNVNIVEMETVVESPGNGGQDAEFSMRIKVAVPEALSEAKLQKHLEALAEEIEETVTMTPLCDRD